MATAPKKTAKKTSKKNKGTHFRKKKDPLAPFRKRAAPACLDKLTQEQMDFIDRELLAGVSAVKIHALITGEWGLSIGDTSLVAFQRSIYRYKANVIRPRQDALEIYPDGEAFVKQPPEEQQRMMSKALKPVVAFESLVSMQMFRVEKLATLEKGKPFLLDDLTKNIKMLSDMLPKLIDVHINIGLLRKAAQQHDVRITPEQQTFMTTLQTGATTKDTRLDVLALLERTGHLVAPPPPQEAPLHEITDSVPRDGTPQGTQQEPQHEPQNPDDFLQSIAEMPPKVLQ